MRGVRGGHGQAECGGGAGRGAALRFPGCGHWFHTGCLRAVNHVVLTLNRNSETAAAMAAPVYCGVCSSGSNAAVLSPLMRCAEEEEAAPSAAHDNAAFIEAARTELSDGEGYRKRFLALLKAEAEQIDLDIQTYDMFEANKRHGKGLLCDKTGDNLRFRMQPPHRHFASPSTSSIPAASRCCAHAQRIPALLCVMLSVLLQCGPAMLSERRL